MSLAVKRLAYLFLCACITGLYGCPYSSPYKLDDAPGNLTDENFIGKWATLITDDNGKAYPVKMILDKKNENEYNISFTGDPKPLRRYHIVADDTLKGNAFMSIVGDRQILNIEIKGQYYLSEIEYKDGKLSLLPLCEHFTVKMIKSNAELRLALELHYKTRLYPLYDEPVCLKDMVKVN